LESIIVSGLGETVSKEQVRQFYDQVGWQLVGECCYQNARYEDLRPVSREYIHRCHMRVSRHLKPVGRFLLDAGSGPIQYPEYLEYSRDYQYRVCADISIVALQEARKRIGDHGLFVVSDVAYLPFKRDAFEGLVSLHTIHHLAKGEHAQAFREIYRVLAPSSSAVVVNGWQRSTLMQAFKPLIRFMAWLLAVYRKLTGREAAEAERPAREPVAPQSTFTARPDPLWLEREVASRMPIEIYVWRSLSTLFLRTLVHRRLGGQQFLRLAYVLEERYPQFFGRYGEYPLVVIRKA
jgi:ubiquinone/menaquinone biosynthesis C-methylase UbiE